MIRRKNIGLAMLVGLLLASQAQAGEGLLFLPPPGCLPADGGPAFPVHVYVWGTEGKRGTLSLVTDTGSLEPGEDLGGGLYRARFKPPRLKRRGKAAFRGTWTSRGKAIKGSMRVPVCPHPTGMVKVQAKPAKLLAGEGQQAFLDIKVTGPDGKPQPGLPLEITTNVGEIKWLRDLGKGKYKAVYLPPGDPFPQVGIIMVANPISARLDRVAVGRAVIPITARIELPGKTARGTKMIMDVAGKKFGPVKANRRGRFKLPILVPPGYQKGKATSIDRVGNRRTRWVNLYLPETNQLGLWGYPRILPADGKSKSRLLVTTIDPFGVPTDIGGVKIVAKRGKIGKIKDIGKGLYEAYYTAPKTIGKGGDQLEVRFPKGGKKSLAMLEALLLPGPVDRIAVQVPDLLPADDKTPGKIAVEIHDEAGNPVGGQKVALSASIGKLGEVQETSPGRHQAVLKVPPEQERWKATVQAEVRDIGGKVPARIMVSKDSLVIAGEQRFLETVVVDGTGRPVEGSQVRIIEGELARTGKTSVYGRVRIELTRSDEQGPRRCVLSTKKGGAERLVYWVEAGEESRLLPLDLDAALPPNAPLKQSAELTLHPASRVNLTITAAPLKKPGQGWLIKASCAFPGGQPAADRRLKFTASQGRLGPVREVETGVYQVELDPGPSGWGRIVVSAVDSESHVGAVTQIQETGRKR